MYTTGRAVPRPSCGGTGRTMHKDSAPTGSCRRRCRPRQMCSSGWSMPEKRHVCAQLYPLRGEGCGELCFITCWTSHERQFDGCHCFGCRSAFLTGAPDSCRKTTGTGARIDVWPFLATCYVHSQQLRKRSRSTSTHSLVHRKFRRVTSPNSLNSEQQSTRSPLPGAGRSDLPVSHNVCPYRKRR